MISIKTTEQQCHYTSLVENDINTLLGGGGDDNRVPCKIAWNPSHVRQAEDHISRKSPLKNPQNIFDTI